MSFSDLLFYHLLKESLALSQRYTCKQGDSSQQAHCEGMLVLKLTGLQEIQVDWNGFAILFYFNDIFII